MGDQSHQNSSSMGNSAKKMLMSNKFDKESEAKWRIKIELEKKTIFSY